MCIPGRRALHYGLLQPWGSAVTKAAAGGRTTARHNPKPGLSLDLQPPAWNQQRAGSMVLAPFLLHLAYPGYAGLGKRLGRSKLVVLWAVGRVIRFFLPVVQPGHADWPYKSLYVLHFHLMPHSSAMAFPSPRLQPQAFPIPVDPCTPSISKSWY